MTLYFGSSIGSLKKLKGFSVMCTSEKHAALYGRYIYKAEVKERSTIYLRSYHDNLDLSHFLEVIPETKLTFHKQAY